MIKNANFSEQATKLRAKLKTPQWIVITTHVRPDGDAMGSALALYHHLTGMGHKVNVILSTGLAPYLRWMPGVKKVFYYRDDPDGAERFTKRAEVVFSLDYGALDRVGGLANAIKENKGLKVMIDHHIAPEDFADVMVHSTEASSTAELIYLLLKDMGQHNKISKETALCLYTGIVSDTGCFKYRNTTPQVHKISGELINHGLEIDVIHRKLFDTYKERRNRFLGYCLHEKMKVLPEFKTSYMVISLKEQKDFGLGMGETEGFVNFNLSNEKVNFGVLIKEAEDNIRFSFRSFGDFPCNEFAANFGGGGHKNASGGRFEGALKDAEEKFLAHLEEYKDQLQYES